MNKLAKIKIDADYLINLLHMPILTEIKDISIENEYFRHYIVITVENTDLLEVKEGEEIPTIQPIIHQINWDWNQVNHD